MVLYPASDFLLRCEKKYSMWYGEKACDGRRLEVMWPRGRRHASVA